MCIMEQRMQEGIDYLAGRSDTAGRSEQLEGSLQKR